MILLEATNRARIQALTTTIDILALIIHLTLIVLSIAIIILLLLVGFMVSKFSEPSDTRENAWFETQKER